MPNTKPNEISIVELVNACQQNDRHAQEILYKMYFKPFYKFCFARLAQEEEVMNILQDAFLKIFTSIQTVKESNKFNAWAWMVLRNTLMDAFRKKAVAWTETEISVVENKLAEMPNENPFYNQEMEEMLRQLPQTTRNVFIHFALDGYPHEEIARKFQISESTSRWHVNAARKILQQLYTLRYGK